MQKITEIICKGKRGTCNKNLGSTDGENITLTRRAFGKADLTIKKHGFGIVCDCGFETLWLFGKQKEIK